MGDCASMRGASSRPGTSTSLFETQMFAWHRPRFASAALIVALSTSSFAPAVAMAQTSGAQQAASSQKPPPLAESLTGMAKAEYEAGRVLYADGDYANAILKFQRAYELSKDPRLLWNVAVCEKNLRRYSRMLSTIRRYEQEAADMLTEAEREQAREIIKTVEAFVSELDLRVSEEGAQVYIDDELVGTTPLTEPLVVNVGTRRIRVTKPGFKEAVVTREVTGGGKIVLQVDLEQEIHQGRLIVSAGPNDFISIDGKLVGQGRWEGVLPSGGHSLRVHADGMQTYQSEVLIQDDQVRRIEVSLNPLPKSDTTATVLWIVGGAAVAAGAAVGGYFLFKPSAPEPTPGTINPHVVQLSFGGRR